MSRVFEYIIIGNNRKDYRAEGVSHEMAMQNFVADPVISHGFHSGNYEVETGEAFIVIGPTQERPDANDIVRLVASERKSFVFRTPEQITSEEEVKRHVTRFLKEAKEDKYDKPLVLLAHDGNIPQHNKTGLVDDFTIDHRRGVWINGKRIPWSAITGIEYADAS